MNCCAAKEDLDRDLLGSGGRWRCSSDGSRLMRYPDPITDEWNQDTTRILQYTIDGVLVGHPLLLDAVAGLSHSGFRGRRRYEA